MNAKTTRKKILRFPCFRRITPVNFPRYIYIREILRACYLIYRDQYFRMKGEYEELFEQRVEKADE